MISMSTILSSIMTFWMSGDRSVFFSDSPAGFLFSPVGFGYICILFCLSFMFGFAYQTLLRFVARGFTKKSNIMWKNRARIQNIGKRDRLLRAGIGICLFVYAIMTTWSPTLLFFSGFCFFEAIFSWCGFYAALGKNTCPIY